MKHLLLLSVALLSSHSVLAQDTYTPPPMFSSPPAVQAQPAPTTATSDHLGPRYSPQKQEQKPPAVAPSEKYTGANNPLLPPIITDGDPAMKKTKAPRAPKKTQAAKPPVPVAKPTIAAPVVATPAPAVIEQPKIAPVEKPAAPTVAKSKAMPAARVTSKGVVTGPKTMPSVPTTGVVVENTFDANQDNEPTLMQRHQESLQTAPATKPAEPKKIAVPANIPTTETLSIPFERGATSVANPPLGGLIQAMTLNPATRLMIEAYGTSTDAGENSDRRIALARAMNLRKAILAQGIAAHRIDIRALGQKAGQNSPERVDLSLYKG